MVRSGFSRWRFTARRLLFSGFGVSQQNALRVAFLSVFLAGLSGAVPASSSAQSDPPQSAPLPGQRTLQCWWTGDYGGPDNAPAAVTMVDAGNGDIEPNGNWYCVGPGEVPDPQGVLGPGPFTVFAGQPAISQQGVQSGPLPGQRTLDCWWTGPEGEAPAAVEMVDVGGGDLEPNGNWYCVGPGDTPDPQGELSGQMRVVFAGKPAGSTASVNVNGVWIGSGYTCEAGVPPRSETVQIVQSGTTVTATKVTGDNCVQAGQVTWKGTRTGDSFSAQCQVSNGPGGGLSFLGCTVTIEDSDSIIENCGGCSGPPLVFPSSGSTSDRYQRRLARLGIHVFWYSAA